jgi:hypothetical protein
MASNPPSVSNQEVKNVQEYEMGGHHHNHNRDNSGCILFLAKVRCNPGNERKRRRAA